MCVCGYVCVGVCVDVFKWECVGVCASGSVCGCVQVGVCVGVCKWECVWLCASGSVCTMWVNVGFSFMLVCL